MDGSEILTNWKQVVSLVSLGSVLPGYACCLCFIYFMFTFMHKVREDNRKRTCRDAMKQEARLEMIRNGYAPSKIKKILDDI